MEPAAKKLKLENGVVEEKESEPQWIRYEDLADSDIDDEYGDMVIVPKLLVNNEDALERINEDITLKNVSWGDTLIVTPTSSLTVDDAFDDLKREEAFFELALESACIARDLAEKEELVFFKPDDFIAPMVKNDTQLEAIRQKLIAKAQDGDEDALRRLNLFDKEQKKAKLNERAKLLARKKKEGTEVTLEDEFNLDLEEAEDDTSKASKGRREMSGRETHNKTSNKANPAKKGMSLHKRSGLKRPGKNRRQMKRGRN